MVDTEGAFTRQFAQIDDGYIYYPSRAAGGKLVTAAEYETLLAGWRHVAGPQGRWKVVALVVGFILVATLVSEALDLPGWTEWLTTGACVTFVSARMLWASFAPARLVKGRPDITPPRPQAEVKREARAQLSWPLVIFVLLLSGAALWGTLSTSERTLGWWAWLIGSGAVFGAYVWVAVQKAFDRQG